MFGDGGISEDEGGDRDNAGGHQRLFISIISRDHGWRSLFEGGLFCNSQWGGFVSRWPSPSSLSPHQWLTLIPDAAQRRTKSLAELQWRSSRHLLKIADWASWWVTCAESFGVKRFKQSFVLCIKWFRSQRRFKCPSVHHKEKINIFPLKYMGL